MWIFSKHGLSLALGEVMVIRFFTGAPGVDNKVIPARLVSNLVVISKVAHLSTTWCRI